MSKFEHKMTDASVVDDPKSPPGDEWRLIGCISVVKRFRGEDAYGQLGFYNETRINCYWEREKFSRRKKAAR